MHRLWSPGTIELCYRPAGANYVVLGSSAQHLFGKGKPEPEETGLIEIPKRPGIHRTLLEHIAGVVPAGPVDPVRKSHVVLGMHNARHFNPIIVSINAQGRVDLASGDTRLVAAREVGMPRMDVDWVFG